MMKVFIDKNGKIILYRRKIIIRRDKKGSFVSGLQVAINTNRKRLNSPPKQIDDEYEDLCAHCSNSGIYCRHCDPRFKSL